MKLARESKEDLGAWRIVYCNGKITARSHRVSTPSSNLEKVQVRRHNATARPSRGHPLTTGNSPAAKHPERIAAGWLASQFEVPLMCMPPNHRPSCQHNSFPILQSLPILPSLLERVFFLPLPSYEHHCRCCRPLLSISSILVASHASTLDT
jgi:hypothetical protein